MSIETAFITNNDQEGGLLNVPPLRLPSSYVPSTARDIATKAYVDVSMGSMTGVPQDSIIYLTSAGSTTPDGLTINTAFSNIEQAIIAANAIAGDVTQKAVVWCGDAGVFSLSNPVTLSPYVSIYAPNATIDGQNNNTLSLSTSSHLVVAACNVNIEVIGPSPPDPYEFCTIEAKILGNGTLTINPSEESSNVALNIERSNRALIVNGTTAQNKVSGYIGWTNQAITVNGGSLHLTSDTLYDLTAKSGSTVHIKASVMHGLSGEKGSTVYADVREPITTITENMDGTGSRIRFTYPITYTSPMSFSGPYASTGTTGSVYRLGRRVIGLISAFSATQTGATAAISLVTPLPPQFRPGTGAAYTGDVMCIDDVANAPATWRLDDAGTFVITKKIGTFSGSGDLYVGSLVFNCDLV